MKTILGIAIVAMLLALSPGSVPDASAASGAPAVAPEDVVGGAWWVCPAYGVVAGIQLATGNLVGAAATLLGAYGSGCI